MVPDLFSYEERSSFIDQHADYWTVVCFRGQGEYERYEFTSRTDAMEKAKTLAQQTGKTYMVYAVLGIYDTFVTSFNP